LILAHLPAVNENLLRNKLTDKEITQPSSNVDTLSDSYKNQRSVPGDKDIPHGFIRSVKLDSDKKYIALTFDLCQRASEKTDYEANIVNYLRDRHIKATFFAGGKWMESHPEQTMQLMADPLFEIGNHSWTHRNLRVLQKKQAISEQIWLAQNQYAVLRQQLINQACTKQADPAEVNRIPAVPTAFRFPYGVCSTQSLNRVNDAGLVAVQWNIVSGDPDKRQTAENMASRIVEQAKPGSIIVAHANGRGWKTADALKLLVPQLQQQGYQFVTVSKLLKAGKAVTEDTCYELKPGDNLRYDKYFKRH
jgi:peptidoglycan/xylan/chitin deacetylase (PgdA/CDA1 family)